MRIALRPSGGRGDYELAGSDNSSQILCRLRVYRETGKRRTGLTALG